MITYLKGNFSSGKTYYSNISIFLEMIKEYKERQIFLPISLLNPCHYPRTLLLYSSHTKDREKLYHNSFLLDLEYFNIWHFSIKYTYFKKYNSWLPRLLWKLSIDIFLFHFLKTIMTKEVAWASFSTPIGLLGSRFLVQLI